MASNSIAEADVLTEVPDNLKKLVRCVMRGFYQIEHFLTMDLLIHHPCIKEDDILDLLKFERKQLRAVINTLKMDKFLKSRMRVETDSDGKTSTRHSYYFINYSLFVNVVKYKLDHMLRKIEVQEREATNRASYKCPKCEKTFTDLEADQLFDPNSGMFLCTYCRSEVEEEASNAPRSDSQTLLVKFNEQMTSLYALLKSVEDVKLSREILEPEPCDLKQKTESRTRGPGDRGKWSGDSTKHIFYGQHQENQVTISLEGDADASRDKEVEKKEKPIWMVQSTIEGALSENIADTSGAGTSSSTSTSLAAKTSRSDDAIMQTLLAHEKKSTGPQATGIAPSDNESSTSESEDDDTALKPSASTASFTDIVQAGVEEMNSDDDDDDDTPTMVMVQGQQVPYGDVTPDMVQRMTAAEKDEYIRIGQEMYQDMYD